LSNQPSDSLGDEQIDIPRRPNQGKKSYGQKVRRALWDQLAAQEIADEDCLSWWRSQDYEHGRRIEFRHTAYENPAGLRSQ
jgi:hypothetical protein